MAPDATKVNEEVQEVRKMEEQGVWLVSWLVSWFSLSWF